MKMRLAFLVVAAVALLAAVPGDAQWKKTSGRTVYLEDESTVRDCHQINSYWDNREMARAEQERTVAKTSSPLRIRASQNGGVHVYGGDSNEFKVKACAVAAGRTYAIAERALDQIQLNVTSGEISVSGPGEDEWSVILIVAAPRDSSIDVESHNGPIGIRNFSGTVVARAMNGPVSLASVTGKVRARTENGPISVGGASSGDFDLDLQNGPLTVNLRGTTWEGKLDGRTQNGPIDLTVPSDYKSGVRVDASEHSPVRCRAAQCRNAVRTWEEPRRIQFGGDSPVVVRLSTVNGPVNIR